MKFSNTQQRKALIDTGACANAISEKDSHELKSFGTQRPPPSEVSKVKLASGQLIPVRGQIELTFSIAKHLFNDKFLVLPSTNSIILGNPFFKNNSIELHLKENLKTTGPMTSIERVSTKPNGKAHETQLFS